MRLSANEKITRLLPLKYEACKYLYTSEGTLKSVQKKLIFLTNINL